MSEKSERARRKLLDRSQWDAMDHYREADDRQKDEFARQTREEERQQEQKRQRAAEAAEARQAASLSAKFEARIAALEEENEELRATLVEIMRATSDGFNGLTDKFLEFLRGQRDIKAEVASTLAELQKSKGAFQFARERDDKVEELPSFLPRRDLN